MSSNRYIVRTTGQTGPGLAAHLADTSDAHDASAISVLDTAGNYAATDVEGVLAEIPTRYTSASVVAHAATGTAATDRAMLIEAIGDTPEGGRLYLPSSADGTFYAIDDELTIAKNISVDGESLLARWDPVSEGADPIAPSSPYLSGAVIKQTAAAKNIFTITTSGLSVNMSNLGLMFNLALASTGHGINAAPSLVAGSGHDIGLQDFLFTNVQVHGHDGNHYGFRLLNPLNGTLIHCRAYGGGGFQTLADAGTINSGNLTFIHPFVGMFKVGTAAGYGHSAASSGTPGTLNMMCYIRPQVIMSGAVATAATNPQWDDYQGASTPKHVSVFAGNLETAGSNSFNPGPGTTWVAPGLVQNLNTAVTVFGSGAFPTGAKATGSATAIGNLALASATAGNSNTAIGGSALTANTTGADNVAVGNLAMAANVSGSYNTAIGATALRNSTTSANTAVGFEALKTATTAIDNTAVGAVAMQNITDGSDNVAVGHQAMQAADGADYNVAVGQSAAASLTSGQNNVAVGYKAGVTGTANRAITTGSENTYVGSFSGGSASDGTVTKNVAIGFQASAAVNATAIGSNVSAGYNGSVAIGRDNSGNQATASAVNEFVLGTVNHQVKIANNTTGAGSAALGSNCPATTASAPYTWFRMKSNDNSTVYVPAWK